MFSDEYKGLEDRFRGQVECDRRKYEPEVKYLPNFPPSGPVDYILVAMEPSTGGSGRHEGPDPEPPLNFSWSVEDFILHYCAREYLCHRGETYHITDLAKGSMPVEDAKHHRQERYERWYPLLRNELALLQKPGKTRLIAVGKVVDDFLNKKDLCKQVERVLHYSSAAASHRDKAIQPWVKGFKGFCRRFDKDAFRESVRSVLADSPLAPYAHLRPKGGGGHRLTDSRMKLMYHYKNRFRELRDAGNIVLRDL